MRILFRARVVQPDESRPISILFDRQPQPQPLRRAYNHVQYTNFIGAAFGLFTSARQIVRTRSSSREIFDFSSVRHTAFNCIAYCLPRFCPAQLVWTIRARASNHLMYAERTVSSGVNIWSCAEVRDAACLTSEIIITAETILSDK